MSLWLNNLTEVILNLVQENQEEEEQITKILIALISIFLNHQSVFMLMVTVIITNGKLIKASLLQIKERYLLLLAWPQLLQTEVKSLNSKTNTHNKYKVKFLMTLHNNTDNLSNINSITNITQTINLNR